MIFKSTKWNLIAGSLLMAAAGILMMIFPNTEFLTLTFVLGALLCAVGLIIVISYCVRKMDLSFFRYDLVLGLGLVLLGVFAFLKAKEIAGFVPVFLGFLITFSGILKLQNALNLLRVDSRSWAFVLVFAILGIALGVVLILNPFNADMLRMRLNGAGLIFSGVTDLLTTVFIGRCIRRLEKEKNSGVSEDSQSISVAVDESGASSQFVEMPN